MLECHHNSALDFQAQKEASYHEAEHFNVLTDLAGFLRLKSGQTVIYKQDYFLQLRILHLENELVSLSKRTNVRVRLKSLDYVMDKGLGEVRRLEGKKDGRRFSKFSQQITWFPFFLISMLILIGSTYTERYMLHRICIWPKTAFLIAVH